MVTVAPDLSKVSRADLLKLEKNLKEIERRKLYNSLEDYTPYAKQMEFHDLGSAKMERLLRAGNRVGKSYCGAAETAYHLTGLYPAWWLGRRFTRPVKVWAASDTGTTVRDVVQSKLCGPYGLTNLQGTGAIPRNCVRWDKDCSMARGVSDLYDTVMVQHHDPDGKPDGHSVLTFKTYEQGRKKWQGEAVDVIWCDEEPPMDVYSEGLTRLAPTVAENPTGIIYTTFTPIEGNTEIIQRFDETVEVDPGAATRAVVCMSLADAKHISAAARKIMVAGWPEHEREAREFGTPMLGSGKIFKCAESAISCEPFALPEYWSYLWGGDFGILHPFAAVLLAWDKDNDIVFVTRCLRMKDSLPLQHVAAMKPALYNFGNKVPFAWPQDGTQRKEFDGQLVPTAQIYKKHGQRMTASFATFPDGSMSTEAGLMMMAERFEQQKLKVFSTCADWFEEYRNYHRKDGLIVKVRDDLMSATRVGVMAIREARPVLRLQKNAGVQLMAKGLNFDLWG